MIVVMTSVSSRKDAESLARMLVSRRLAACVSISALESSIYRWKEKVEEEKEFMLLVKTRKGMWEKVRKALKESHPYKLPEIIALPAERVSPEYRTWVENATS